MNKYSILLVICCLPKLCFNQDTVNVSTCRNDSCRVYAAKKATRLLQKNYLKLLREDFSRQVTAPFHLNRNDWLKLGISGIITSVLFSSDEAVRNNAIEFRKKSSFIRSISPFITQFGGKYEIYTLGALTARSIISKNEKLKTTVLLATQAYLTSSVWVDLLKATTGRVKPFYQPSGNEEMEPNWYWPFYQFARNKNGKKNGESNFSAFPSGHTAVAFAVATVFAKQYRDNAIVPILAYSVASMVGVTRVIENTHWASDIPIAAALGYVCAKQVLNNYHRFIGLNSYKNKKENLLDFDIRYNHGVLMSHFVYTFR